MNIAAIKASLKGLNEDYILLEAETASEGIRLARREKPALILLDIRLPDMDGFELAKTLKAAKQTKYIPIIYISGLDDMDSKLTAFTTGGVDYITKPFHRQEVMARVNTQLKIHRLQNNLATRNREIQESIGYAKQIQEALMPSESQLKEDLGQYFIFFQPKDILSGDMYWAREYHGDVLIACIDCTGHGIPGALISLVGHNLLNQATGLEKNLSPAEILQEVDRKLIETLNQSGVEGKNQDGMDIALCRISKKKSKLVFAGAYRPMYLVRNGVCDEWKGDKQPVGGTQVKKKVFTNQEISLKKGDMVYLLTDGFTDQFGSEEDKKFSGKRLRKLLAEIGDKSVKEQKKILQQTFQDWASGHEQVDDVLLIGLSF
ncbi:MAG: SpoIIE family protein phosphatase [Flavobacteriales bacterium]|nr:SpoIIE family protein phosphatase [Flavobacteriales bacterium]MCB9449294.1 SpoIIE family protein phosphatase [Flavobacteriales bacterium]